MPMCPWVFSPWPLGLPLGSSGLLRTASSLHCSLIWVQFWIVWGRAPLYFLTVPGLGLPSTSSMEQSYSCWVLGSLSVHISARFQRRLGGWLCSRRKVGVVSDPPGSPGHVGPGVLLPLAPGPSLLCLSHI